MSLQRRVLKSFILWAGDTLLLYVSLVMALALRYGGLPEAAFLKLHIIPFSIIFILTLLIFYIAGLYELRTVKNTPQFYDRLFKAFLIEAVMAIALFYLVPYFSITPRANLFLSLAISFGLISLWRWGAQTHDRHPED